MVMNNLAIGHFDDPDLEAFLTDQTEADLDTLDFGVIGIDLQCNVVLYNHYESTCAGLSPERVKNFALFTNVAPCMNNFMVAHRFEEALEQQTVLDTIFDYVLTLRMRPSKVKLRLLAVPGQAVRYVLVKRPV